MQFFKMYGFGNDFMVVDVVMQNVFFLLELICCLVDCYFGVGFDQLLVVELFYDLDLDFYYWIFNVDGSEVLQCGNGVCCFVCFVWLKGLINKCDICVSMVNGCMVLSVMEDDLVWVNMGEFNFELFQVLFCVNKVEKIYIMCVVEQIVLCGVVFMGNLYCVIQVDDVDMVVVEIFGLVMESYECFLECVNIGFMQVVGWFYICLCVYECGVGEIQVCGSGVCVVVVVGIQQGLLVEMVCVELFGGCFDIVWKGLGQLLFMIGLVVYVYDGFIYL